MSSVGIGPGAAATSKDKLPVLDSALRSWTDGWRAIRAMPVTALIAFASLFVIFAADSFVSDIGTPAAGKPGHDAAQFGLSLLGVALNIIGYVLVAPFLIAVARHVLLKQVTKGYPFDPSNVRFLRFAGFAIVFGLLIALPDLLNGLTALVGGVSGRRLAAGVTVVATVAVVIVMVRRVVLFPAIAVDAADAGWRQARMLTKGHSWRVFLTILGALLPLAIALFMLMLFLTVTVVGPLSIGITKLAMGAISLGVVHEAITGLLSSTSQILLLTTLASAVSHIYRAFDPTLGQPVRPIPTVAA